MRKLGTLRGIAILAVVISHAADYSIFSLVFWGARFGSNHPAPDRSWVGSVGYHELVGVVQLTLFAVPLFLFASGFFVAFAARGQARYLTWTTIRGWINGIFQPYLAWMSVSAALYALNVLMSTSGMQWDPISFLQGQAEKYYYVPMLAALLLFAPGLFRLAIRHPIGLLASLALVQIVYTWMYELSRFGISFPETLVFMKVPDWWLWYGASLSFYFSLGLVIGCHYGRLHQHLARFRWPITISAALLGLASIVEADISYPLVETQWLTLSWSLPTMWYSTALILALVSWDWRRGRITRSLDRLGVKSLGIYLIQPIVIGLAVKLIYLAAPRVMSQPLAFQALLAIVGIGLPLAVISAASRTPIRRYQRQLFG